jgi:glycosyltransferase involved in cell wall biosynthesis
MPPLRDKRQPFIYIACPWTPKGGGMFKVADYLIQSQAPARPGGPEGHRTPQAQLRPLDTRGSGSAAGSLLVLAGALARLLQGRLQGQLAGVHVNMAERLSLVRKSAVVLLCRALGVPVVLHVHAAQLHHFYRALPRLAQALTRRVFSLADCCVVLGQASRRFVTEELGVPAERVRVLINGVPPAVAARRVPGRVQRVLFVGHLSTRKGVPELLAALALPGWNADHTRVSLVGGGKLAAWRQQTHALGLSDWVHLEGWATQERVSELMAQADVLVLPSHDEGLPLVILEALSHGVAVVCTPVGEIADFLQDGEHALFVPPGNAPALAAQLQRLLADTGLREHLERQGQALYETQFSMHHFFEGVAHLHREVFGVSAAMRRTAPAASALPAASAVSPVPPPTAQELVS